MFKNLAIRVLLAAAITLSPLSAEPPVVSDSFGGMTTPHTDSVRDYSDKIASLRLQLETMMTRIQARHGAYPHESRATLRAVMEEAGIERALRFCNSWGDGHAALYLNEVKSRVRPTTMRLRAAQRKKLTILEYKRLENEAYEALRAGVEMERLLELHLDGVLTRARIWERRMHLEATVPHKHRIRIQSELDELKRLEDETRKTVIQTISMQIKALPKPGRVLEEKSSEPVALSAKQEDESWIEINGVRRDHQDYLEAQRQHEDEVRSGDQTLTRSELERLNEARDALWKRYKNGDLTALEYQQELNNLP